MCVCGMLQAAGLVWNNRTWTHTHTHGGSEDSCIPGPRLPSCATHTKVWPEEIVSVTTFITGKYISLNTLVVCECIHRKPFNMASIIDQWRRPSCLCYYYERTWSIKVKPRQLLAIIPVKSGIGTTSMWLNRKFCKQYGQMYCFIIVLSCYFHLYWLQALDNHVSFGTLGWLCW